MSIFKGLFNFNKSPALPKEERVVNIQSDLIVVNVDGIEKRYKIANAGGIEGSQLSAEQRARVLAFAQEVLRSTSVTNDTLSNARGINFSKSRVEVSNDAGEVRTITNVALPRITTVLGRKVNDHKGYEEKFERISRIMKEASEELKKMDQPRNLDETKISLAEQDDTVPHPISAERSSTREVAEEQPKVYVKKDRKLFAKFKKGIVFENKTKKVDKRELNRRINGLDEYIAQPDVSVADKRKLVLEALTTQLYGPYSDKLFTEALKLFSDDEISDAIVRELKGDSSRKGDANNSDITSKILTEVKEALAEIPKDISERHYNDPISKKVIELLNQDALKEISASLMMNPNHMSEEDQNNLYMISADVNQSNEVRLDAIEKLINDPSVLGSSIKVVFLLDLVRSIDSGKYEYLKENGNSLLKYGASKINFIETTNGRSYVDAPYRGGGLQDEINTHKERVKNGIEAFNPEKKDIAELKKKLAARKDKLEREKEEALEIRDDFGLTTEELKREEEIILLGGQIALIKEYENVAKHEKNLKNKLIEFLNTERSYRERFSKLIQAIENNPQLNTFQKKLLLFKVGQNDVNFPIPSDLNNSDLDTLIHQVKLLVENRELNNLTFSGTVLYLDKSSYQQNLLLKTGKKASEVILKDSPETFNDITIQALQRATRYPLLIEEMAKTGSELKGIVNNPFAGFDEFLSYITSFKENIDKALNAAPRTI